MYVLMRVCLSACLFVTDGLCAGTRYVVVDCGGGTVDITVHELSSSGQLIELHRATGGPHGSTGTLDSIQPAHAGSKQQS